MTADKGIYVATFDYYYTTSVESLVFQGWIFCTVKDGDGTMYGEDTKWSALASLLGRSPDA